jgi:drug/metabolite transporter (DMT)-like permease
MRAVPGASDGSPDMWGRIGRSTAFLRFPMTSPAGIVQPQMLGAFLTTVFFSLSAIFANRSARLVGGTEANFWRLICALCFLSVWAFAFGQGFSGASLPVFLLSGVIGIGIGDIAFFQALPRVGPRMTVLLTRCTIAPMAATMEWLWLGAALTPGQIICGVVILTGVGISLAPGRHTGIARKDILPGVLWCLLSALGDGTGAVLSRKANAVAAAHGEQIDGGTAAFQRVVGGLVIAGACFAVVKWHQARKPEDFPGLNPALNARQKLRRAWPWILANSLTGQTLGVSCYQWALRSMPTGIVLPIVATTPLVTVLFTMMIDGERPTVRSLAGDAVAVAGVVGLSILEARAH